MADRGFESKVQPHEWSDLGAKLAKDFSRRSEGDTFLLALEQLANRLSAEFPSFRREAHTLPTNIREV